MFIATLSLVAFAYSQALPIWSETLALQDSVKGEYCNTAIIRSQRPLLVRVGPSRAFAKAGSVAKGAIVYICNERADRKIGYDRFWQGIAYKTDGKPCTGAEKQGLPVQLSRQCATGWVERELVETLTG
jgi:hypothetical protein